MTNRQWLMNEMQNMSDEELENNVRIHFIWDVDCDDCTDKHKSCLACKINWLQSERKPKLSDAERVILENVDKKYKWICRDNYNIIYFCRSEPRKSGNEWQCDNGGVALSIFNHLFQFIKWEDEQAYNIQELLEV